MARLSLLLLLSGLPASVADDNATSRCSGDGSSWENELCRQNPSFVGCIATPGCNWAGRNMFGGWCTGAASCNFRFEKSMCAAAPNCTWTAAAVVLPPNYTEASEVPATLAAADRDAPPSVAWYGCQGVHSWCYDIPDPTGCMWTPGCHWGGQSRFGGHCRGGRECWYQPTPGACGLFWQCWWQPDYWAAGAAQPGVEQDALGASTEMEAAGNKTLCAGDGTSWENGLCRQSPSFVGCIATPGCSWAGQNMFGGLCTGAEACNFHYQKSLCAAAPNCAWVNATVALPPNYQEPVASAADEADEVSANEAGDAHTDSVALSLGKNMSATWYGCQGVYSWCYDIPDPSGCMWTPGCHWDGRNYFGGQCRGGAVCWPQPTPEACSILRPCWWQPGTWAADSEQLASAQEAALLQQPAVATAAGDGRRRMLRGSA